MYDGKYVKRRRRKKAAVVIIGISTAGLTALAIVSFLGRYVGTFTVSLRNNDVKLTLSERSSFENTTSYLRISELQQFDEFDFNRIINKQPDNEEYDYTYGASYLSEDGKPEGYSFFKYTFFVKNVGYIPSSYELKVKILDDKTQEGAGTSTIKLSDIMRVMVYENDSNDDTHNYHVYAKPKGNDEDTVHKTKDGEVTNREFVSRRPDSFEMVESDEYPLAENFYDVSTVTYYKDRYLGVDEYRRYTIVTWLEGYDPQSSPTKEAPIGATIKLGVEITAYED